MTMKKEAESLKEKLDTKNKMLTASIAESEKFKRIAGIKNIFVIVYVT